MNETQRASYLIVGRSILSYSWRSPRNANVGLSVCAAQSALEQSIFIFLGQRALRKQPKSKLAVREQSEHYNKSHKVGA